MTEGRITDVLAADPVHYRLAETPLRVDYRDFEEAVAARRHAGTDAARAAACHTITTLAATTLAGDLAQEWVEPLREDARRHYLNAVSWLAAHAADPYATLGLLEVALENDAYNELLWQDVLRLHARLGERDALNRTYTALTTKLAEIGEEPDPDTRRLFDRLRSGTDTASPPPNR